MSKNIYKKRRTFKNNMPKYEIRDVKDKSILYGIVESENPDSFDGWDKLNNATDHFEVKQFQQIFDGISFQGPHRFIFTMDVKSLYTVIRRIAMVFRHSSFSLTNVPFRIHPLIP